MSDTRTTHNMWVFINLHKKQCNGEFETFQHNNDDVTFRVCKVCGAMAFIRDWQGSGFEGRLPSRFFYDNPLRPDGEFQHKCLTCGMTFTSDKMFDHTCQDCMSFGEDPELNYDEFYSDHHQPWSGGLREEVLPGKVIVTVTTTRYIPSLRCIRIQKKLSAEFDEALFLIRRLKRG